MHVVWCGVRYTRDHRCMKSQLYQLLLDESDSKLLESDEFSNCVETVEELPGDETWANTPPTISLHALLGLEDSQTMRLKGRIKQLSMMLLVDSESTHNFIDQSIVKRLGYPFQSVLGVSVTVANGDKMLA